MIDIAEKVGLTRLLLPMQKIKLVKKERNPRDARVSLVKLSDSGQEILENSTLSFERSADSWARAIHEKQK